MSVVENGSNYAKDRSSGHLISDAALERIVATSPAVELFKQRPAIRSSRHVLTVAEENLDDNLVRTTLAGSGMLSKRPFVYFDDINGSVLAFYHVGRKLAGHPKLVHGGLIAVILDECMGRACFPRLSKGVAVTAKLEIQYQKPMPVDSVVSIHAETTEVQGRKAWVSATVEDASSGIVLMNASGLFIEPKWAADIVQA